MRASNVKKIGNIQWWDVNETEHVQTGIEDGHTVHTNFTPISTESNSTLAAPILTHSTIQAGGYTCRAGRTVARAHLNATHSGTTLHGGMTVLAVTHTLSPHTRDR